MAVKGKRKYTVYLSEEEANLVRRFVEMHGSSLSDWLNENVRRFGRLLKSQNFEEKLQRIAEMSLGEYRWFMEEFPGPPEPDEDDFPPVPEDA